MLTRIIKKGSCFILAVVLLITFLPVLTQAAAKQPVAKDNLTNGLIRNSYLEVAGSGFMRVYYDGKAVRIEYYDGSFHFQSAKKMKLELPVFGGFYKGEDGSYYLVEGKYNQNCKDGEEVLRIIKYNSKWKKTGSGSIYAKEGWEYEIRYPFDYGCVNMTEVDGKLYVITGREGYVDPQFGQGHQGMMLIRMDEKTFKTEIVYGDFWHSFAQYIDHKGTDVFLYELSEGSRATYLSRFDANSTDTDYFNALVDRFPVFEYGGSRTSSWAIPCYATVEDFALSANNALGIGVSIDQSKYDEYDYSKTPSNLYLTVTPFSSLSQEATSVIWLTSYKKPRSIHGVQLTKINDNRFLVSWEISEDDLTGSDLNDTLSGHKLHYQFIDGNGKKIGSEFTAKAALSDCHPILAGDKIVYYASDSSCVDFYSIHATTGAFQKKVYRTLGGNATWSFKGGILTVSGSGKIGSDADWSALSRKIKKIVVKKGIKDIGANAFSGIDGLKEVVIEDGVTSIGKEAFAFNGNLKKVAIPSSVKKLGADILWTGAFWYGDSSHVVYASIYTTKGSYAAKYAKKNNISCVIIKAANPLQVKVSSKTFQQKKLKSQKTFQIGTSKAKGKVSYKLDKKAKTAGIKVSAKGKVAIPKNCRKGVYKITVTAKGNSSYKAGKKVVTIKIK